MRSNSESYFPAGHSNVHECTWALDEIDPFTELQFICDLCSQGVRRPKSMVLVLEVNLQAAHEEQAK